MPLMHLLVCLPLLCCCYCLQVTWYGSSSGTTPQGWPVYPAAQLVLHDQQHYQQQQQQQSEGVPLRVWQLHPGAAVLLPDEVYQPWLAEVTAGADRKTTTSSSSSRGSSKASSVKKGGSTKSSSSSSGGYVSDSSSDATSGDSSSGGGGVKGDGGRGEGRMQRGDLLWRLGEVEGMGVVQCLVEDDEGGKWAQVRGGG